MSRNDISLIISAPSGAGKTTVIAKLLTNSDLYSFSISTTTRLMRDGEVDGENYNFIDVETLTKMIRNSEFLEWANVHGNL
jgi:guanylate kinase